MAAAYKLAVSNYSSDKAITILTDYIKSDNAICGRNYNINFEYFDVLSFSNVQVALFIFILADVEVQWLNVQMIPRFPWHVHRLTLGLVPECLNPWTANLEQILFLFQCLISL